jgi:hypothetical protein
LLLVGEDRREPTVGEPAVVCERAKRPVDLRGAVELGEIDRFRHLVPQPVRTRGGLYQPGLGAVTECEELPLLRRFVPLGAA